MHEWMDFLIFCFCWWACNTPWRDAEHLFWENKQDRKSCNQVFSLLPNKPDKRTNWKEAAIHCCTSLHWILCSEKWTKKSCSTKWGLICQKSLLLHGLQIVLFVFFWQYWSFYSDCKFCSPEKLWEIFIEEQVCTGKWLLMSILNTLERFVTLFFHPKFCTNSFFFSI